MKKEEKYYSRFKIEEKIINILIGKNPNEYKGTYIDIGAATPNRCNNTYYYYLKGWKGMLVEPRQKFVGLIRKVRPNDVFEQVSLMDYDGEIEMYQNAPKGSPMGIEYVEQGRKNPYVAKCITTTTLLEKHPDFKEPDFISLDIATGEEKMLKGCDFNIFKPKVMCIEYMDSRRKTDYRPNWEYLILPYYDVRHIEPWDIYYVRKDYKRRGID